MTHALSLIALAVACVPLAVWIVAHVIVEVFTPIRDWSYALGEAIMRKGGF